MSLSSVFDVKGVDTVKALTTILNEYDQMPDQPPDETGRPKVHLFFLVSSLLWAYSVSLIIALFTAWQAS
jgi:hypothetical protein